ncbi:DUF3854 domain-containing protein [Nostoc sp. FACHB-152]|uniref:DUF3854 domain-containing protein n=1 Tax=Nostoc sp. FACHB-152 TaxID=2692837 RepID=UPI0016881EEA|nr:DUF3854 domain-containing protein [Nostoc sp. FACHB-152]MBD2450508.1 DUF3854 domain-containing protein [Nostoc sp. FACHB-152]
MFDERHLQLTSAYARSTQHFVRAVIYPLANFLYKSIEEAIDLKCKIELGQDTYALTPDGNNGWKWSKLEREVVEEEFAELEELLEDLLPPLLPGNNTTPPNFPPYDSPPLLSGNNTTPPNFPPYDSPPLVPTPDSPLNIPPAATSLEFMAVPLERQNAWFYAQNNYQPLEEKQDITDSPPVNNSFHLDEVAEEVEPPSKLELEAAKEFDKAEEVAPSSELEPHDESSSLLAQPTFSTSVSPAVIEVCPPHIDLNHWQELINGSAIAPSIAELNFKSLHFDAIEQEHEAWEYLLYSTQLERLNTGRLKQELLYTYAHIEHGGWWCSGGVNPTSFADLKEGEQPAQKIWGCYKPNQPREKIEKKNSSKGYFKFLQDRNTPQEPKKTIAQPKKFIKYEHPPKTETSFFLLEVPNGIAEQIYLKSEVSPSDSDRASGFWYCVWKHNIPITITEGAKKAACLLSQGEAAIGVPGIYNGYRKQDDGFNLALHPELAVFATKDRHFKICFDYETKPKTKRNINIATYRTGQLLEMAGSTVSVVQLPGPPKGVDDLIVAHGADAYFKISAASVPLDQWWQNNTPPDFRLTIIKKDGTVKTLYEQKGDGTVTATPDNLTEQPIDEFLKLPPAKSPTHFLVPTTPIIDAEFVDTDLFESEIPSIPQTLEQTASWSRKQEVTLYQQNFFRKNLEAKENQQIASAAYALLKKYGTEPPDIINEQAEGKTYQADAFIIKNHGDKYSIYRRHDQQQLMTFQADQWGHVGNIKLSDANSYEQKSKQQISILPIERQEFLLVADYLKSGKPLPSVDEDPRTIASSLASLSPGGTHNLLESFKQAEVLKILTQTLTTFQRDELTLSNYHIRYQDNFSEHTSILQLFKTEHDGTGREAVRFELKQTDTGITHQVMKMAITEADLNKLRLLAQKLDIQRTLATMAANFSNATRDVDLPVHPHISKQWQNLDNRQPSPDFSTPNTQSSASVERPIKRRSNAQDTPDVQPQNHQSQLDNLAIPIHPQLADYWQQLESNNSWATVALHGHAQLQEKIQLSGKLTIGEQRELYQKIQNQAWYEIQQNGQTSITLPPLAGIIHDLRTHLAGQTDVQTYDSDPVRDPHLPLHQDIATHWHNLEQNKAWKSVANQYNYPLRDKLEKTGKLSIGEQRELYYKILLQSQVEQHNQGKTDISLPPLEDILQDLMAQRRQFIDNTYTPKTEIYSQQSTAQSYEPNQSTSDDIQL